MSPVHPSESQIEAMLLTLHARHFDRADGYRYLATDLATCSHLHRVLVTIVNYKEYLPPTGLHYWSPGTIRASSVIPSNGGPDDLRYVQGFQELGTFWVPESNVSSLNCIHDYLGSFILRYQTDEPSASESEIIESIVTVLADKSEPSLHTIPIHLYTISVRSNTKDELFNGGPVPVWKWVKPQSAFFHKSGFWETDVGVALDCGEWERAKEVLLLVRGIAEEAKEKFVEVKVEDFA